ncbi:hypothetical protein LIA77_09248 [Sarocladium implicatum]|nr:hypothetical protein LIA77_09248 [Sarocladium implicatum]
MKIEMRMEMMKREQIKRGDTTASCLYMMQHTTCGEARGGHTIKQRSCGPTRRGEQNSASKIMSANGTARSGRRLASESRSLNRGTGLIQRATLAASHRSLDAHCMIGE